jgi:type II secretory pathway pseudopilin PulG
MRPCRFNHHAGFSFVEVLFAVMILGVGFIMLAAMFPVAIQQTQTASDESTSAAVAWNALALIQAKLSDAELPAVGAPEVGNRRPFAEAYYPGVVRSFRDPQAGGVARLITGQPTGLSRREPTDPQYDPKDQITFAQPRDYLWSRIKGESVVVDDRRFAWVAFYKRHIISGFGDVPAPYAQVVVVVARARESSAFGPGDVTGALLANLQPRPVTFDLTSDGAGPVVDQVVKFTAGATDAVAEGAYLIVAHDKLPPPPAGTSTLSPQGAFNANVYRVGNRIEGNTWELSPDADFAPRTVFGARVEGLSGAEGYVIGKAPAGGGRYAGVAQDVAVYTMFIPVH